MLALFLKKRRLKSSAFVSVEPVVPDVTFTYSETTDLMVGKSLDCRLGCAAILKTMHTLAGQDLNVDIVGACAAQEEVGVRGATVTAQVIKPDIAIVFEGCPADDTCVEQYMVQTAIKRGPMLRHIDSRMITNPRYQRYALDLAEKLGIPVQDAVRSAGSTNGAVIHLTEKAVPVIVIGVPVRYAHTHYGISAYADFDNAVRLACEILKRLDEEQIMSFKKYNDVLKATGITATAGKGYVKKQQRSASQLFKLLCDKRNCL